MELIVANPLVIPVTFPRSVQGEHVELDRVPDVRHDVTHLFWGKIKQGTSNSGRNPGLSRQPIRNLRTSQNHELTQVDEEAAAVGARRLLARSRLPSIRGYTRSVPRYGFFRVGCLKQMPNAVF